MNDIERLKDDYLAKLFVIQRDGLKPDDIHFLMNTYSQLLDENVSLKNQLMVALRIVQPKEKRNIDIVTVDSSTSKITINPCTGRITVKVSNKSSNQVVSEIMLLVQQIYEYEFFQPYTYRGKIKFHKDTNKYTVMLLNERVPPRHGIEFFVITTNMV
jgi:hypothetical protein